MWSTLAWNWVGWREAAVVLQPDTVVRRHRAGLAAVLDLEEPAADVRGRWISPEIQALIRRMAQEIPRWGTKIPSPLAATP